MTQREALLIAMTIERIVEASLEPGLWDTRIAKSVVGDLIATSPKVGDWLQEGDKPEVKEWLRVIFGPNIATPGRRKTNYD